MAAFITNQKKLASAAQTSDVHLSNIKRSGGVSDDLAARLEAITGISRIRWAKGGASLSASMKKFFRMQREAEETSIKTALTAKYSSTLSARE